MHSKKPPCRREKPCQREGAILIVVAMMMFVLIVTVVISIDVAFMQLTRTELRTATDAATRAASESLSRTQSAASALAAAKSVALQNKVHDQPLVLTDDDVQFGRSTQQPDGTVTFVENATPFNSVRISGRRTTDSVSGAVPLFFGRILGVGSFEPSHVASSMNLDRDIVIVVDRSGSMKFSVLNNNIAGGLGNCDPPHPTDSRWAALNSAVQAFISGLNSTTQSEYLGLVSYGSANTSCDMTFNVADIEQQVSSDYSATTSRMAYLTSIPINGATNISAGIDAAITALTNPATTRPLAEKTMVVLTDGMFNQGSHPVNSAATAANQGIVIHTVTFSDFAEQVAMQQVANATGGNHYHAPTAEDLEVIFEEIAKSLPVVMTK